MAEHKKRRSGTADARRHFLPARLSRAVFEERGVRGADYGAGGALALPPPLGAPRTPLKS